MMASKAAKVDSSSAEYLTEVGYQCLLQGRNKEATRYYKNATKLDESSVAALTGNGSMSFVYFDNYAMCVLLIDITKHNVINSFLIHVYFFWLFSLFTVGFKDVLWLERTVYSLF